MSNAMLMAAYLDDEVPGKLLYHELSDGIVAVERRQDVEGLIAQAKAMKDIPPGREFRHVGFVPDAVLDRAFNEGWFHDKKAWKRWLNDSDNRAYRTWEGRV